MVNKRQHYVGVASLSVFGGSVIRGFTVFTFHEIFEHTHLKFTENDWSKQAKNNQPNIRVYRNHSNSTYAQKKLRYDLTLDWIHHKFLILNFLRKIRSYVA